ncbi:IS1096 element passenger TnpR family protein [Microvirga ossetica]|uniref:IS1096 element passenger TnpR family protein n=1 Tax=Microvirga ossetica TaxID=1882682 RepID=UPI000C149E51
MTVPWEHGERLEGRHGTEPGRSYPICMDRQGACPPEDCGGVNRFLVRREASAPPEVSHDFAVLADFVDQLALERSTGDS